jgi:NTE family protein
LEEAEIPIDFIAGTSFGSIIGALYSIHRNADTVEKEIRKYLASPIFKEVREDIECMDGNNHNTFWGKVQNTLKKGYFYTVALYRKAIITPESFVANIKTLVNDYSFKDMCIPFKCMSVDLISGNPIIFSDGDLVRALQASCATPGFFPPVEMHKMLLVDGGVAEMIPVGVAKTFNPDYIIGSDITINIETIFDPQKDLTNWLDVVSRSYAVTRDFLNMYESKEIDCIIKPDIGACAWYDFEPVDNYIKKGYDAAIDMIPKIKKDIFWF